MPDPVTDSTPVTAAPLMDYDDHRDERHGGHTCPNDDWRKCEAICLPRQRWAATAVAASLVWHFLDGPDDRTALCGEHHRGWQRVEEFSTPAAFDPCQDCVKEAVRDAD